MASAAQAQLAGAKTDIDLADYEPDRLRPSPSWLTSRRRATDEIGALGSMLLLSADNDAGTSAQIADRLEALADRFAVPETKKLAPVAGRQVKWMTSPLFRIIDTGLRRLEEAAI